MILDGETLNIEDLYNYSKKALDPAFQCEISFSESAIKKMKASEDFVKNIVQGEKAVYGINTGFGRFAEVKISATDLELLQDNIIKSHACGMGEPLQRDIVMAMWLMRLNVVARGNSGVQKNTLNGILDFLKAGFLAEIPSRGSVGASGDLCPSSHAVLAYLGDGMASIPAGSSFQKKPAKEILNKLEKKPLKLGPKEGLALINGTQLSTVLAVFALQELKHLIHVANLSAAMMVEGLRGSHQITHSKTLQSKNQEGTVFCGNEMRLWLTENGALTEIARSHVDCGRVQDAYSLRCAPVVHGALWDEILGCENILNRELNSSTDNPLIFAESSESLSGGNFHAIYPARVSDRLASAAATLASISERRIALAMNADSSRLPTFLIKDGGLNSGYMMIHVTAAALASEAKTNSFPASVDTIPTNDDREDHVSMGPTAGYRALKNIELARQVLAIELMTASQAIDLLRPLKSSPSLERAHQWIRTQAPYMEKDISLSDAMNKVADLIKSDIPQRT